MLSALVTSKVKRKLLGLLFLNSGQSFYVRELSRKTNEQVNAVRRELRSLEAAGFVFSEWRGKQLYYQANKNSPVYSEIRGLVLKTEGLVSLLADALGGTGVLFAFIYGSYARGEEGRQSDVDLMVIGEPPGPFAGKIREIEKQTSREINYSVYPQKEFLSKLDKNFLPKVLEAEKIMVLGEEDGLKRFAEGKPVKTGGAGRRPGKRLPRSGQKRH